MGVLLLALAALLAPACGDNRGSPPYSVWVGADEGGLFTGEDAGGSGGLDARIEENHVQVTFITLSCAGDCATVVAVATGGSPPYTFAWDDGTMSAARQVCPTASTSYAVKVTDTGTSGELMRPAESVRVTLTANVLSCPDGSVSVCEGGAGSAAFESGHYVGTVTCPPDGGVVSVPSPDGGAANSGTVTLDLAVDGTTVHGGLYYLWSIGGTIAYQASLEGTLDCSKGDLHATWENVEWGLPATAPDGGMTVLPTGTATGDLSAAPVSGSPGAIVGAFDFVVSTGSCLGTYTATLQR